MSVPKPQEMFKIAPFWFKTQEMLKVALSNSWTCPRMREMLKMLKMFKVSRNYCLHKAIVAGNL